MISSIIIYLAVALCIFPNNYISASPTERLTADPLTPTTASAQHVSDANALCAFKLGITNWPTNLTALSPSSSAASSVSPTAFAPTMYPTISPTAFTGWNCDGTTAVSFPCGTGAVSWTGVKCGGGSGSNIVVVQLGINEKGLSGTISSSLSAITSLTFLSLSGNQLSSTIPNELSALTNLINLDLGTNLLNSTIPSTLSALVNLQYLLLYTNRLTGQIPPELSALSHLRYIYLYENRINGTIPSELSKLTKLTYLYLYENVLTRTIASELSTLTNLIQLQLNNNRLTGPIPFHFSSLTKLRNLWLYSNSLVGPIPSQFSTLINLHVLWLNNNSLSSSIPSQLSTLRNITSLQLQQNLLNGTIPSQLGSLALNLEKIYLHENKLMGLIPSRISALTNLKILTLYNNSLTGSVPPQVSMLKQLEIFDASQNSLVGTISSEFSALTDLTILSLYSNKIEGSIPSQLSSLKQLQYLLLFNNSLGNTIPPQLFTLNSTLVHLSLNNNKLTGEIPSFLGNFLNLTALILNDNGFIGTIPDMFNNLINLQYLVLGGNALSGNYVPSSLSSLRSSLIVLDLSGNRDLRGDPFSFCLMGFVRLTTLNVSGCGFDDLSSLNFDLPPLIPAAGNLACLDISDNYFEGSLPDDIGLAFPNLSSLFASNNCLDSYIPASICKLTNLDTILLNKLYYSKKRKSTCKPKTTRDRRNDLFSTRKNFIPTCLWSLPVLKTAHFITNGFEGPLGDVIVGGSLKSIAVTGNLLTGPIPKSMQQSSSLTNIQLSLNRLDGVLEDDAFQRMPPDSTLELFANRISGDLPSYLYNIQTINGHDGVGKFTKGTNILNGNLFNCSKPPDVDEKSGSYSCGSSSIDAYKWVYLVVVVIMVVLSIIVYAESEIILKHAFLQYYRSLPFPSSFFSSVIKMKFLLTCTLLSLFSIFFNLIMRGGGDSRYYGTVDYSYGWATTFSYVHSETPFIIVTMIVSTTLFAFLYNLENKQMKSMSVNDASQFSDKGGNDDVKENGLPVSQVGDNVVALASIGDVNDSIKLLSLSKVKKYLVFAFILLLNIFVITAANVVYVALITNSTYKILNINLGVSSAYRSYIPVGLSVFKIIWSVIVDAMARLGLRAGISPNVMLVLHCMSTIYNDLLVPIVVIYSTSANCFYYFDDVVGKIPKTSEVYTQDYPYESCEVELLTTTVGSTTSYITSFSCQYVFQSEEVTIDINPSWIYSYSCESTLFTSYIPLLLTVYTISAIVMPLLQLFLLSFPPASRVRNNAIVVALLPFTLNVLPEHNSLLLDKQGRYLRTFVYLSKLAVDILMLFTFGIACGYLTFLIIASIVIKELITHLQIGSYLADRSKAAAAGHLHFEATNSFFVDEMRYGFIKNIWQRLLLVVLLFWSLFVFDTIADVYGNGAGLICVICYWVFLMCSFFSKEHMERVLSSVNVCIVAICKSIKVTLSYVKKSAVVLHNRCIGGEDDNFNIKNNKLDLPERSRSTGNAIELGTVHENPIRKKQLPGTVI